MKPAECRRLALAYPRIELDEAANALIGQREPSIAVHGVDQGERLTHVLIALRIRTRLDLGEEPISAFRAVMRGIRALLTNTVSPSEFGPELPAGLDLVAAHRPSRATRLAPAPSLRARGSDRGSQDLHEEAPESRVTPLETPP